MVQTKTVLLIEEILHITVWQHNMQPLLLLSRLYP